MKNKQPTLCWSCAKSDKGKSSDCPWARDFTPVDGWKAKKTVKNYRERRVESFLVKKCPLYEKEPPKNTAASAEFARAKGAAVAEIAKRRAAGDKNCRYAVYAEYNICRRCGSAFRAPGSTLCRPCGCACAAREQKKIDKKKGV